MAGIAMATPDDALLDELPDDVFILGEVDHVSASTASASAPPPPPQPMQQQQQAMDTAQMEMRGRMSNLERMLVAVWRERGGPS